MGSDAKEVTGGAATVELASADGPPPKDDVRLPRIPYDVYEPGEEIGRGGLGRVIRAVDRRLKRTVAIKELLAERRGSERRFAREAFITAGLEHPSIVSVHEAGRWPNGQPFYAMKLISGRSLAEAIRARGSLRGRLELVPKVTAAAEAIAYAHARRVIHRDIKPENVILGDYGETVVIDWGLAKRLGDPDEEGGEISGPSSDDHTVAGAVLGTPSYMPPEQARAEPVDQRADVYALGALLYHVLAGSPPYRTVRVSKGTSASGPAPSSVKKPSAEVLAEVLAGPPAPLAGEVPHAPRDLLTIVEKAMARAPADRYPTAREMADDLLRFQTGQLVSARHYSPAELARRWFKRHRAAVLVGAAALAVLAVGGALAVRRVIVARGEAEARRNELIVAQARGALERDPTATLAWLAQLPEGGDWGEAHALAADAASRGFARHVLRRHGAGVWMVAASPDGKRFASASADGTVILQGVDGAGARTLAGHDAEVNAVAFSADGERLASGGDDGGVVVWSATSGAIERMLAGHDGSVTGVAFTPDGKRLLSIGYDRTVRVWDLASGTGRLLGTHGGKGQALAVSPDGRWAASVATGDPLTIWALDGEARRTIGPPLPLPRTVAVAPDGATVAVPAPSGGAVTLYGLDGAPRRTLPGDALTVMGVAFSRDGARLAVAGTDKLVRVWDLRSGAERALAGHEGSVNGVTFLPSGDLISGAGDRSVRVWSVPALDERVLALHPGGVQGVAFRDDGLLLSAGKDGTVRAGGASLVSGLAAVTAMSARGATVVAGCDDGSVHVVDTAAPAGPADRPAPRAGPEPVIAVAWQAGVVAWLADDGLLRLRGVVEADVPARDGTAVAFSPDGATLFWTGASELHACPVSDCAAGARTLERQRAWVRALGVAPDGALVGAGGGEGALHLLAPGGGAARVLAGHESSISCLAFGRDAGALATAAQDGEVRLWDLAAGTGRPLRGHGRNVVAMAFSRDGRRLATASFDRTARLWDVATGRSRLLLGHEDRVDSVAFAPDDATLATGSRDGTVRIWKADLDAEVPAAPEELRRWVTQATAARVGRDGSVGDR